jgi:hypothetical protein
VTIIRCVPRVLLSAAIPLLAGCDRLAPSRAAGDVPAAIVHRYDCPPTLPVWWTAADSSLGSGDRCSLVAAAVSAIADGTEADSTLAAVDPNRAACVRAERIVLRDPGDQRVVADTWLVAFYSDAQPDVVVAVQTETGSMSAFINPRDVLESAEEICAPAT